MAVNTADTVDIRGKMQAVSAACVHDFTGRCQHRVFCHQGCLIPVAVVGQQGPATVHQHQFGQYHCRIGSLEIAKFGLDVAEIDFVPEAGFNSLLFHGI